MTLSTPKSELTSARMFVRKSHAEVAYWIDTDAAAMDGEPGRNNRVAATRSAAERLIAAHDALGFIDQTIYANDDNFPLTPWRNEEVLELLISIRMKLLGEATDREIGSHAHDCSEHDTWPCSAVNAARTNREDGSDR